MMRERDEMPRRVRVPKLPWWAFWTVFSTVILWGNTESFLQHTIELPHHPVVAGLRATLDALLMAASAVALKLAACELVHAWYDLRE